MTVTFRQLEIFVEAAQDCNFRKTADRIGISQPSLSNQIMALERHFGEPMFERRRGSPAKLSVRGEALLPHARNVLQNKNRMKAEPPVSSRDAKLNLTIAAGSYLLDAHIRPSLARLHKAADSVAVSFVTSPSNDDMLEMVRKGSADLALFTGSGQTLEGFDWESLCRITVSVFGSPEQAAALAGGLDVLDQAPFVMPPEGSESSASILRDLAAAGVRPANIAARSQFADVLAGLAVDGVGFAVLFDEQVAMQVAAGALVRLPITLKRWRRVMVKGDKASDPRATAALEHFRNCFRSGPIPQINAWSY